MTGLFTALLEGFAVPNDVFYISFANEAAFLGGCFVIANDEPSALAAANAAGINPGGEALILGPVPRGDVKASHIGRLMADRAEIEGAMAE